LFIRAGRVIWPNRPSWLPASQRLWRRLCPTVLWRDIADPAERIIEAPDGHVISLNGRELVCLDTPGHARHHICIVDHKARAIFTGDMFGLSYRELDVDGRQFIFRRRRRRNSSQMKCGPRSSAWWPCNRRPCI
jgi:glyoxylase-like metal-dependent hydrolase (beta-lactamase superfamily II)